MKTFDPVNSDSDFEGELKSLIPRRPPAGWRDELLQSLTSPPPQPPRGGAAGMPKALLIGVGASLAASAFFIATTPKDEILNLPELPPSGMPSGMGGEFFTLNDIPFP